MCLDVLNSRWTPVSDLVSVFTQFLPQLLRYPNPADPLNGEAAQLLLQQPQQYHAAVVDCVARYAMPATGAAAGAEAASTGAGAAAPADGSSAQPPLGPAWQGGVATSAASGFDFDGVDLGTMDGASQVSDLSDF